MTDDTEFRMPTPDPALQRLGFLVGKWKVDGTIEAGPAGPGGTMNGVESFEWLEGGFFLVHRWEGTMEFGGATMADSGYEFYDVDPATGDYRARFFNSLGPYDDKASLYVGNFEGDALVVVGPARIIRRPAGADVITYDGDLPDGEGGFVPWLRTTLTRIP